MTQVSGKKNRFILCARPLDQRRLEPLFEQAGIVPCFTDSVFSLISELGSDHPEGYTRVFILIDTLKSVEMQVFQTLIKIDKIDVTALSHAEIPEESKLQQALILGADEAIPVCRLASYLHEPSGFPADAVEKDSALDSLMNQMIDENRTSTEIEPCDNDPDRDAPENAGSASRSQLAEPLLSEEELQALLG